MMRTSDRIDRFLIRRENELEARAEADRRRAIQAASDDGCDEDEALNTNKEST